jgi:hypothetical protein
VHPASEFLRYLVFYGMIAATSLEYKLS